MPMVYQQNINPYSRLGLWHITEPESFFAGTVSVQREISHPQKRLQHLAGRFLLQQLFPGFPYELVKIADTRRPFVQDDAYHFSISHCGDYAAALVSTHNRAGVDVELISPKVERVRHKFLSEPEQQMLETAAHNESKTMITLLTSAWSIKESLFKWYGDGEVDFIDHLHIDAMNWVEQKCFARCTITKARLVELVVEVIIYGDNCVSWVISDD